MRPEPRYRRAMAPATDSETLLSALLLFAAGLFIAYLGYRIRYRGDVHLIAGYDAERVTDDEGLAALVGGVTVALGALHPTSGVALLYFPPDLAFWSGYGLAMAVGLAVVLVGGRRFTG